MTDPVKPLDLSGVTTYSILDRKSIVSQKDFAKPWNAKASLSTFMESLPSILAGRDLSSIITALADAHLNKKNIIFAMGAHVIKVGLTPILINLMEQGILTMISMNGAGIIHDIEVAMTGSTSEDVAASLDHGTFGMGKETAEYLGKAIDMAAQNSMGLGRAVGELINQEKFPFRNLSLTASCARLNIPITVHVAMGTDIIHMHPTFDPAACGAASHRDFRIFSAKVANLAHGVFINAGSAVIMPEVFLKALTLVRNLGHEPEPVTTVNLDFIRHYRPMTNVVSRPTHKGGKGFSLVGHHEILIPLIAAGLIDCLDSMKHK